jgi:membrane-bound acyltransferase YfiQ involved in biofilm formation
MTWNQVIIILIPILIVELSFRGYAIYDLVQPTRSVKFLPKNLWLFFVIIINFGWVFYFLVGREDSHINYFK